MQRRDFIRQLSGSVAVGTQVNPLRLFGALDSSARKDTFSKVDILVDARGKYRPIQASALRLGGQRIGKQNLDTVALSFTNLYLQRMTRSALSGQGENVPFIPVSGEFHYARFPWQGWEDELRKLKAGGLTVVSTYLFWILHEPVEGQFQWTGRRNLRHFLELCHKVGLEVILRIGPFAHGEMRNGGLPDWLYAKPFQVRSDDPDYLQCVRRFYQQIGEQAKGYLFEDGGPVVGIQIENEFMSATAPWEISEFRDQPLEWIPTGSGGPQHMVRLKQIAMESGLKAPIYTCTAWGSPVPEYEFLPMFGGYGFEPWSVDPATHLQPPSWSYVFLDSQAKLQPNGKKEGGSGHGTVPFACCELGAGMQCFYKARFIVPPESVQGIAVASLGSGCAFLGYYVFHGGSNPSGEAVFYNEYDVPHISYDFQAPIGEYGQIAPSYRLLRPIHLFLKDYGALLAPMETVLPAGSDIILPGNSGAVRCAVRAAKNSGFLFLNNYQDHVTLPNRENMRFRIALDSGQVCIPERGEMGIAAGEAAILPFAIALGPVKLRYATAQLITQVEEGDRLHVFFHAPRGMKPEFCLEAASLDDCSAPEATIEKLGKLIFVRGDGGLGFHIACRKGKSIVILHLLTRSDSLRLSKHRLWGQERVVFSDADVAEADGDLLAWKTGNTEIKAHVFPPPAESRTLSQRSVGVPVESATYHVQAQAWKSGVTIKRLSEDTMHVSISPDALNGVDDILLRIDYCGDIGQAFAGGVLVADNFCNGAIWEIGLKYLYEQLRDRMMVLKVIPRMEGSSVVLDANVSRRERFEGKRVARIDAVDAVPVYKVRFNASGVQR
jgi:beta-galactosidase